MRRRTACITLIVALVAGSAALAQGRRELQFPDLPGLKTLKCDFHVHTVFSDGVVWPTVRVDEAWREGLDAIALTDHIEYQPHKDDLPTNYNRSYEIALPRARERNLLLIRAAEITRDTPPGHFNALFLKDIKPLRTDDLFDVFQQAANQGAFIFWNHPNWKGTEKGRWAEVQDRAYENKQLRGIEIVNGDEYDPTVHNWAIEKNLTLMGNTDIHDPSSDIPATSKIHRTMTLVFARERTVEAIHEALNAGSTAVWCGNRLFGSVEHLSALFAGMVEVRPPHHQTKDELFYEVVNKGELDIALGTGKKGTSKPRILPARSTSLVRLARSQLDGENRASFRVENFRTAPDRPLEVKLAMPPAPATQPVPTN